MILRSQETDVKEERHTVKTVSYTHLDVYKRQIWYHSDHDTPDKIEPEQMARAALCHLEMIMELLMMDSAELKKNDRRPHEEVVDAMIPENRTLREECGLDHGFTFNIIPETPKTGERVYMYQTSVVHDPGVIIDTVWDFGDNASPGKGQFTSHVDVYKRQPVLYLKI